MTANEAVLVGTAVLRCVKRDIQLIVRESSRRVKATWLEAGLTR
jgi:hypothetical protein